MEYAQFDPRYLDRVRVAIQERLTSEENIQDVLMGCQHLAKRRADLEGREPSTSDLEFALSIFSWWKWKPDPAEQVEAELMDLRPSLFRGAGLGRFEELDSVVPDRTLRLTPRELYVRQQTSVRAFLEEKPMPMEV